MTVTLNHLIQVFQVNYGIILSTDYLLNMKLWCWWLRDVILSLSDYLCLWMGRNLVVSFLSLSDYLYLWMGRNLVVSCSQDSRLCYFGTCDCQCAKQTRWLCDISALIYLLWHQRQWQKVNANWLPLIYTECNVYFKCDTLTYLQHYWHWQMCNLLPERLFILSSHQSSGQRWQWCKSAGTHSETSCSHTFPDSQASQDSLFISGHCLWLCHECFTHTVFTELVTFSVHQCII